MSHQPAIAVLAPVSTLAMAAEAARAGARLVDTGGCASLAAAVQRARLGVLICGQFEEADLVRDAAVAIRRGSELICAGAAGAERAERQGVSRDRLVVQVAPRDLAAAAGWRTLVDVDPAAGTTADAVTRAEATATVCAWQGASIIRTQYVSQVRRCLDMTECIMATRPPAWAVRGLG
jgi:hypothetical protein